MLRMIVCGLLACCVLSPLAVVEQRAQGQIIFLPPPKKVEKYKKGFTDLDKKAQDVLSGKAFESTKYKEKKTGKELKYSELPAFAQKIVQISAIEKLTKELTGSYDEWKEDLKKLKKVEDEKLSEKDEEIANFTDVTHYQEKLLKLRKDVAVKYESAATSLFDKFSEKFTKEESQGYLGQMRRYHDTQKLVERKKEK